MTAIKTKPEAITKLNLQPVTAPIGNIIIDAVNKGEIKQFLADEGAYYHYTDVIKLLHKVLSDADHYKEIYCK
jgi:hypothetical protein